MATTDAPAYPVEQTGSYPVRKVRRSWIVGAAIAFLTVLGVSVLVTSRGQIEDSTVPATESSATSSDDITRDLVSRGLIPAQSLEPGSLSTENFMRDLVSRGLIPAQSLDD